MYLDLYPARKTKSFFKVCHHIFAGIDTIKIVKKGENNKQPKRKIRFWPILLIIIMIPLITLGSVLGAHALKEKIDFLKLLRQGKYLVLFQNNAEMRPSGGFIGSFAIVELQDYKIKSINFNTNIYKLDKAFSQSHIIPPPAPLDEISGGKWALRDANFAVSFPEAAQKIEWFYEAESGEKVDGVIAINASVVQDLLKIVGPIDLPQYQTTITAENFFENLASKIEVEYFLDQGNKITNEPKSILKDMMPKLFANITDISKIQIAKLIYEELSQKQILLYTNNTEVQKAILGESWGGEIKDYDGDYLTVNNANIAEASGQEVSGKSSLKIKEAINYKVEEKEGLLWGNLNLTRSHSGSYEWPDGINHNWTRILVPKGTLLKQAELNGKNILDQVLIGEEAGKTSFALWIQTAPGTSNVLNLSYLLPLNDNNYQLLVQKQPGNLGDDLQVSKNGQMLFDGVLDTDKEIK